MPKRDFEPEFLAYLFHFLAGVIAVLLAAVGLYFDWQASDLSDATGAAGAFGFLVAVPFTLAFIGTAGLGVLFTLFNLRLWPLVLLSALVVVPCLSSVLLPNFELVFVLLVVYPVLGIVFFVRRVRSERKSGHARPE